MYKKHGDGIQLLFSVMSPEIIGFGELPRLEGRHPRPPPVVSLFPLLHSHLCRFDFFAFHYRPTPIPRRDRGPESPIRSHDYRVQFEYPTFTLPFSFRPKITRRSTNSGRAISFERPENLNRPEIHRLGKFLAVFSNVGHGCHGKTF